MRSRHHRHAAAAPLLRQRRVARPVLCKIHPNLGSADAFPGEADCTVHASGVCKFQVAEKSPAALALVKADFSDFATFFEKRSDLIFSDFPRQAADPYRAAILRLLGLRLIPILAHAVRCQGLVLCEIHANGHPFDC